MLSYGSISRMTTSELKKTVLSYYKKHGRYSLPWRKTKNPYKIWVSEIMLQQTQVDRVVPKYKAFIKKFPTVRALAQASLRDVLLLWQGLGYNRRALYLKRGAEEIIQKHKGAFPKTVKELETLSGIGHYTARAITTFAYNEPHVFIETNIRTVYLHHFFPKKEKVLDTELLPYIEKTLDFKNPREWYAALMDYGSYLKKTFPNPGVRSTTHVKQVPFKGSLREVRGAILRNVTQRRGISKRELHQMLKNLGSEKIEKAILSLKKDSLIRIQGEKVLPAK